MADAADPGPEVPPAVAKPRMSLAKMKQNKLQKKQKLVRANSSDASNSMMSASRDFMSDPGTTPRGRGAAGPHPTRSMPIARTRSVTFSEDARYCSNDSSEPESQPDSPFASDATVNAGSTPGARGPNLSSSRVFNAKGEMQVDSDEEDDYEEEETHAALRASNSFAAPSVPDVRALRPSGMILGDYSAPIRRWCDSAPSPPVTPGAWESGSMTSMNSSIDAEDAKDVGLVQVDWMAVADERYTQKQDIVKLEVRFRSDLLRDRDR